MDDEQRSKRLAYLLRHRPEAAGLTLDQEGWCDLATLLAATGFTDAEVQRVVATDQKGRYTIEGDRIRANQGHSVPVQLKLPAVVPPPRLYHGTTETAMASIRREGLRAMSRHHVHLTDDLSTARAVGGRRRGRTVVLEIDAAAMLARGHRFYRSVNDVWLTDVVPPMFIHELKDPT